jgi:hypothetical protein
MFSTRIPASPFRDTLEDVFRVLDKWGSFWG